ncbi:polysaccharide deacetylase family protein [Mariannaea sp. PMI_226]|nr:polysaccharide deacetylase family protein [Mariannaea sp. PMI_226]
MRPHSSSLTLYLFSCTLHINLVLKLDNMFYHILLSALAVAVAASPVEHLHQRRAVPVGTVINGCTKPNTVAIAFDDGPYTFTDDILDTLANSGVKATFFVNGDNYASIYDYQSTIQRMVADGHQVASHTWSHPDLTTLSSAQVKSQMTKLESALVDIIGKFPTYMRPPYLTTNSKVLKTLGDLGYHVIEDSIDTHDWENDTPDAIKTSEKLFNKALNAGGSITLCHDVYEQTADALLPHMISAIKNRGLKGVTVGECLGQSKDKWYRTSR